MKKILLILLGMVSIFSLTSCSTRETISDEEVAEIKSKFARQDYKTIAGDYSFLVDVRMTATIDEDRSTYNESTKQNTSLIIDGSDSSDLYSFASSFTASEDNQTFDEDYVVMISEMTKKQVPLIVKMKQFMLKILFIMLIIIFMKILLLSTQIIELLTLLIMI